MPCALTLFLAYRHYRAWNRARLERVVIVGGGGTFAWTERSTRTDVEDGVG